MDRGEQLLEALWTVMNKKRSLDRSEWKTESPDLNSTELRCIEYVGHHPNVAASKLTKKLLSKGFLVRYQKLENRKEVYFRLTEQGEALYQVLAGIREKINQRDRLVFDQLSNAQYETILGFAKSYSDHLDRVARQSGER